MSFQKQFGPLHFHLPGLLFVRVSFEFQFLIFFRLSEMDERIPLIQGTCRKSHQRPQSFLESCFTFSLTQKGHFNHILCSINKLYIDSRLYCSRYSKRALSENCKVASSHSVLIPFPLPCIPPIQKLKYPCTHCTGGAIQKEFSETFLLPFYSLPSLKISECCQKSALTQAGMCSATYSLPFHCLLMKDYVHVQNKFDSLTETYLSVLENNSWDCKVFFQDEQQQGKNTTCQQQHMQQCLHLCKLI